MSYTAVFLSFREEYTIYMAHTTDDQTVGMIPTQENHASIEDKINAAMVTTVYKQNYVSLIASLFGSIILFCGLYFVVNHLLLITWFAINTTIILGRLILVKNYLRQPPEMKNIIFWRRTFIVGACLGGLTWGFATGILFPYPHAAPLTLSVLMLAGVAAGSVPVLAGILPAALLFLVAAILPLTIRLIFINDHSFILYDAALIVYLIYLVILSIRTYKEIYQVVSLQYENNTLLQNLSEAKNELERINKKLKHAATHDLLTDLTNRSLFNSSFAEAIRRAKREQKILALLFLDIDHFKETNDAYGHHVGDLLLQKVVERIMRVLPTDTLAARFGGDEITIIFENIANTENIAELAKRICEELNISFQIKDYNISISASIGISIYPLDGRDAETMLRSADKAMYHAKSMGGNSFHFNTELSKIKS